MVRKALENHPIYALEADLQARGLSRLVDGVQVIGYDTFVDLVVEHNVVPWL
ncbi:MAG: DsrH/TusB family sulfur metabolism protein [Anaerolineales bacterium]